MTQQTKNGKAPPQPVGRSVPAMTATAAADSVAVYAEQQRKVAYRAFTWAVKEMNDLTTPLVPGRYYGAEGLTGSGKTWFVDSNLLHWTQLVARTNRDLNRRDMIARVVTEETVQEGYVTLCNLAGMRLPFAHIENGQVKDIDGLRNQLSRYSDFPIIFIGETLTPKYDGLADDVVFGSLTVADVYRALQDIRLRMKQPNKPDVEAAMLVVGNIQMMTAGINDKRVDMERVAYQLKQISRTLACPVIDEIQARRELLERKDYQPTEFDVEHAFAIAQAHDGIMSIARPLLHKPVGEKIDEKNDLECSPDLFIGMTAKWRKGSMVRQKFALRSDMSTGLMSWDGFLR